jgi:MinD-like ATPase involved in chromosome partitioning or flagellar assembly
LKDKGTDFFLSSSSLLLVTTPASTTILVATLFAYITGLLASTTSSLGNSSRHNSLGHVQVVTEEEDTLIGKVIIVVLPAELLRDITTGFEGLHDRHDVEVGYSHFVVLGCTNVLLNDHDTL